MQTGRLIFVLAAWLGLAGRALAADIPDSGMTGGVSFRDKAGLAEGRLLTTMAIELAAGAIAGQVEKQANSKPILVVPGGTDLSLAHWRLYELRLKLVNGGLNRAVDICLPREREVSAKFAPPVVAAGEAISVAAKIGSFFQSKYEIGGIEFTRDEDLLATAVAAQLLKLQLEPRLPVAWADRKVIEETVTEFEALQAHGDEAVRCQTSLQEQAKTAKGTYAATLKRNLETVTAAIDNMNALVADLAAPADKSPMSLTLILAERQLAEDMKSALVLKLKTFGVDASYYSKTNLWTFLGAMPAYVAGTAVVGYQLYDGDTRKLLSAGVATEHGGFYSVAKVKARIDQQPMVAGP